MTPRDRGDESGLAAMLSAQRWFGAKSGGVRKAALRDTIPLSFPGDTREYAVGRVDVSTDEGGATYQIFFDPRDDGFSDALADASFRLGLARAFEHGAVFGNGDTRWVVEREGRTPFVLPPDTPVSLGGAQQSNTSMVVQGTAILKLYRRLEPGIQPDLEITRFLTVERDFGHVPALLGSIRFEDAEGATAAGLMQQYVRGAQEAWGLAVASARAHANAATDAEPDFAREAARIGAVTRALHETLASGDAGTPFEARRAAADDVRGWAASTRETIAAGIRALQRAIAAGSVPPDLRAEADAVASAGDRWAGWIDEAAARIEGDAGIVARTHGDYHLGQVLRSDAGEYLVIDFEGEPARPLRERRAPQSPLRDVAGMLRSFDYAAAVGGGGASGWREHCRASFLRGYERESGAGGDHDALRWPARARMEGIVALFECEKVFYELRYELGHRPDWLWIPLRAVAALAA